MFIPKVKLTSQKRLSQLLAGRTSDARNKRWREDVLERDRFKCQWPNCNCEDRLEVHHIKKWSKNKQLRFNTYNGITLCHEHHIGIQNKEHFYEVSFLKKVMANDTSYKAMVAAKKEESKKRLEQSLKENDED